MSQLSESNSGEDGDISPLEYARLNGISRNYLAEPLPISALLSLHVGVKEGFADDALLQQFDFGAEIKIEERLSLSKDAVSLLASVAREETLETIDSLVLPMLSRVTTIRNLRLELPLLKSDHETDCKTFARREDFETKIQDVKLPLEAVHEENNEGPRWPVRLSKLGSETLEKLKQERLSATKDVLTYLQQALKVEWTKDDEENLCNSERKYKRVRKYQYSCARC